MLGIPPERLYISYFGGDSAAGLEPDEECRYAGELNEKQTSNNSDKSGFPLVSRIRTCFRLG